MNFVRTKSSVARIARMFVLWTVLFLGWSTCRAQDISATLIDRTGPTGEPIKYLKTNGLIVQFLAYSPDGSELAVNFRFSPPLVLNSTTWQNLRRLPGLRMMAYSPNSVIMATAEGNDGLRLWRNGHEEPVRTLVERGTLILYAAFSPDGKTLASTYGGNSVRIWDVETGENRRTLQGHTAAVLCTAFSTDGKLLVTGSEDGNTRIWDAATWETIDTFDGPENSGAVLWVALSPDGKTLVTVHQSLGVMIWDTERRVATIKKGYFSAAFSPDGKMLAIGGRDILLWEAAAGKGKDLGTITLPKLTAKEAYSEDMAARLLKRGEDPNSQIRVEVHSLAYSPDGGSLAAGCLDGTVRLLDTQMQKAFDPPSRESTGRVDPDVRGAEVAVNDGSLVATNEKGDRIEIVSFLPEPPTTLGHNRMFKVQISYQLSSVDGCRIRAVPMRNGEIISDRTSSPSPKHVRGSGVTEGWFFFRDGVTMDQVRIQMVDTGNRKTLLELTVDAKVNWSEQSDGQIP